MDSISKSFSIRGLSFNTCAVSDISIPVPSTDEVLMIGTSSPDENASPLE